MAQEIPNPHPNFDRFAPGRKQAISAARERFTGLEEEAVKIRQLQDEAEAHWQAYVREMSQGG